jgi:SAM-dependent methyltransferase
MVGPRPPAVRRDQRGVQAGRELRHVRHDPLSDVLARYYDWLGRFYRIASWFGRGGAYDSLAVHRLLASERPDVAPADVVHERILAAIGPLRQPRVLDAGCGLGGTVFYLHRRVGGRFDGLTLSPSQRARAEREAARRGVAEECRFHLRSYDGSLVDLAPDGADLVVAIESLAHSPDPVRSIANLGRTMKTGGRLVIVDDVPDEALADDDPDFAAFREGWRCPAVARRSTLEGALAGADLIVERDDDLTALVSRRSEAELERLVRGNRRWRAMAGFTGAAGLIDSLYGGLMLERLYRRGVMRYRMVVARRKESSG